MVFRADVETKAKNIFIVKLAGRLDGTTYKLLEDRLKTVLVPTTKALIFDMGLLEYISSVGLGVIFGARKFVEANNGTLLMINFQPRVKRVFDMIKVLPKQPIFESIEELDNYLDNLQKKWNDEEV